MIASAGAKEDLLAFWMRRANQRGHDLRDAKEYIGRLEEFIEAWMLYRINEAGVSVCTSREQVEILRQAKEIFGTKPEALK